MNWNAIGAVSEVFGVLAVVVSVVYLAAQVRKQIEEARLTASRDLAAQLGDTLQTITENGEFAAIWLNGVRDYEALPDADRIRLSFLFQRACRIMEQHYRHTARGNLDVEYNQSVDNQYAEFFSLPGVQRWWELSKGHFEPGFRDRIDEMMASTKENEYESTFKRGRGNAGIDD
jgi:hypothetical protein